MFTRIVTSALFAGFAAGLIFAVLQFFFVQPVLVHAELYEAGTKVHFGVEGSLTHGPAVSFEMLRNSLSILFSALLYTGYGLMLVAGMALADERGVKITARNGILWGLAGFIAVQFAPAISLPPEVPGSAAAGVAVRQMWWFSTVGAAALAMALLAFGNGWKAWGVSIILLLLPHIIGAPHPDMFAGTTPPELASLFAMRSLAVDLAAWIFLGLLAAYFWQREAQD
jgi:cobalt transporter subunit CbtA